MENMWNQVQEKNKTLNKYTQPHSLDEELRRLDCGGSKRIELWYLLHILQLLEEANKTNLISHMKTIRRVFLSNFSDLLDFVFMFFIFIRLILNLLIKFGTKLLFLLNDCEELRDVFCLILFWRPLSSRICSSCWYPKFL